MVLLTRFAYFLGRLEGECPFVVLQKRNAEGPENLEAEKAYIHMRFQYQTIKPLFRKSVGEVLISQAEGLQNYTATFEPRSCFFILLEFQHSRPNLSY